MRFPGNRVVKTAVAVFLTAFICQLIGWPPVFAVITAIVTLEPTVSDSIKKGIIRFPASAIGSFYAVLFISLFGNSPITYTLAATLTIITCYRLKLHDGLLVATITAVAMIEVVYNNFFMSFVIRLGTTTIGITVSTLVNLLIFPPNFMKDINRNLQIIYDDLGHTILSLVHEDSRSTEQNMKKVNKLIEKTEELVHYEANEVEYFKLEDKKQTELTLAETELEQLRFIRYHVNNLRGIQLKDTNFNNINKHIITNTVKDIAYYMIGDGQKTPKINEEKLRHIMEAYWKTSHLPAETETSKLPNELVLLYELLSIAYLVKDIAYKKKINKRKETRLQGSSLFLI